MKKTNLQIRCTHPEVCISGRIAVKEVIGITGKQIMKNYAYRPVIYLSSRIAIMTANNGFLSNTKILKVVKQYLILIRLLSTSLPAIRIKKYHQLIKDQKYSGGLNEKIHYRDSS